jgi:hypothetical protein
LQAATIPEKEESNHDRHQRVELKTAVTSGKKRTSQQDPEEDPKAGIHEASKRDVWWVSENEELDLVEMSAPSKTEKEAAYGVRAGDVGAPASPGVMAPTVGGRERK